MTTIDPFICMACKHYNESENTCGAYPNGVPLFPGDKPLLHDVVLKGQEGDMVFEYDEEQPLAMDNYEYVLYSFFKNGKKDPGMDPNKEYKSQIWDQLHPEEASE